MKLLGEALINKDIELMDELFDWECVMFPVGGGERKYSYQRDVIKEIWNTKNFQITSYDYTIMSLGIQHFLHPTWQCFFEMRIIDSYGNEYILTSLVNIRIENFYDFKIIHSNTRLTENPI